VVPASASEPCVGTLKPRGIGKRHGASAVDPRCKGGLTEEQVQEQLIKAETSLYEKLRFGDDGPSAEELYNALFASGPIEWNRIGAFQDV
jgi:hypothetical protein